MKKSRKNNSLCFSNKYIKIIHIYKIVKTIPLDI